MANAVKGVIAGAKGAPVSVETILVPDPGPGEALVRIQACGVCHTDLHYREGAITNDFPFLLGHEASGIVEQVGPNVTNVAPGDFVILAWRAPCGTCRSCLRGRPWYCFASRNAQQKMTRQDGTPLSAAIGIGAFAELALVAAGQAVKVNPAARPEAAGLVGCGIMAGLGAAINTAGVSRGDSVAVIGCGGVGNAAIAGAKLAGAHTIIGVDVDDRKLEWAKQFGATHTINSRHTDPVQAIRELTKGRGVDHAFEAVGNAMLVRQAVESLAIRGTATVVGVPPPDTIFEIPFMAMRPECKLQTSRMGSNQFRTDIPRYLGFYRDGRLRLDEMVTRRGRLDEINDAFRAMKAGEVARTVLTFE